MRSQVRICITVTSACHLLGWIGLCSVLPPRQHSIGYMGDGFYRSKDILLVLVSEYQQKLGSKWMHEMH